MTNHILYVLAGPTGIGKSQLAISLARRHNAEIIGADSRQVYRYMDIGTAKPSFRDRNEVRHHLLDLFSPEDTISAGKYAGLADKAMTDIWKRKKMAFLVGGSGLYIRACLKGIFDGPGRNEAARKKLEREAEKRGSSFLYKRLNKIDRAAASKIHPNDTRRIIRALEVYMVTGKKISEWQKETPSCDFTQVYVCLYQNMQDLYKKIDTRVDQMLAKGLVDEVKGLVEKGFGKSFALIDTIGYKEILEYLNGKMSLEEAIKLLKRNSRRFAKRQMTWFRGHAQGQGLKWIEIRREEDEDEILATLEEAFGLRVRNGREGEEKLVKSAVLLLPG